jgi:hypothetical protein
MRPRFFFPIHHQLSNPPRKRRTMQARRSGTPQETAGQARGDKPSAFIKK